MKRLKHLKSIEMWNKGAANTPNGRRLRFIFLRKILLIIFRSQSPVVFTECKMIQCTLGTFSIEGETDFIGFSKVQL